MVEQDKKPAPIAARPGPVALRRSSAEMMTPKEILTMLRQHVWMIVSLTIVGLLVGSGAWYLVRKYAPKYTARTVFRVLPPAERDPMTITSAMVQKDIQYGYRMDLASILKQQSTLQELIDRDKIQATKWFKNLGQIKDIRIREAVKDLEDNFNAIAQKNGEFVSISMTCGDKFEAALIVNEMLNSFLAKQGSTKRQEITERLAKLEERRDRIEQDLAFAEDALDEVRKRWELTDLEERDYQNPIEVRLNDLELQHNDLLLQIKQVDATMKNLERLATGPINEQIEYMIERDPVMLSLAQQLVFQKSELAAKLTKFGENHRVVRQIQEFIKETKQRRELRKLEIAEQTRLSNLQDAQDQLIVLSQRLEELNKLQAEAQARKKDLDLARIQYEQRTSIRDERKKMLDSIKTQIEKLKIIHDDPQTPKVQFVGFAPIPFDISSPRMTVYLPGGTMLGLMLGIGLALLIELLNDLVRTPRDVGRHLHIKLLGMIPDISEDGQTDGLDPANIVIEAPYSILSESYRRLRTNLKLSAAADSSKVLLISSPMTADGKTSVAVNLAATFIAENKKVLLMDANLKSPGFAKIFSNDQLNAEDNTNVFDKGLSSLLAGQVDAQEVIKANVVENLDIIYAGPVPSNPSELLGSDRMKKFIQNQQDKYDYIIIDGPPALLVSDTKVLTRIADATVLVFNAGTTRRGVALRTIRELREVDTKIIGCALLAVKSMKGGYFREQFKSYREYQKLQPAGAR